jgi:DNA-binding response OmpR family regulator
MTNKPLAGRLILVAEDEVLISLDIENTFKDAGACVRICSTVEDALAVAEHQDLSAAVVNHLLHDGESSPLCARLKRRGIPFVLFSGFTNVEGACRTGIQVHKPTTSAILLTTVAGLLRPHPMLVQSL